MLSPRSIKIMIEAMEERHHRMSCEVLSIIDKSEHFLAAMLAKDVGLELDQVVRWQGELAIIENFTLDKEQKCGLRLTIVCYHDDELIADVNLEEITL